MIPSLKAWPCQRLILSVFVVLHLLITTTAHSETLETACYQETRGDHVRHFSWLLEGKDPLLLRSTDENEQHLNVLTPQGASLVWQLTNELQDTEIHVTRSDSMLYVQGRKQGQALRRSVHIDEAPWYQALSVALRTLLNTETTAEEFWMVRPDTLEVRRMQAEQRSIETIKIGTLPRQARHIRITAVGIPAWLWSGDYWLDAETGKFLRYRGRSGPPGSPIIHIDLSNDPCPSL